MNKLNNSTLYILLLSCFLSSQPKFNSNEAGLSEKRLKDLEILMNGLVDEGEISGFQSAIMRKGVLGHYSTYGYADIDKKILLKDDNIFSGKADKILFFDDEKIHLIGNASMKYEGTSISSNIIVFNPQSGKMTSN